MENKFQRGVKLERPGSIYWFYQDNIFIASTIGIGFSVPENGKLHFKQIKIFTSFCQRTLKKIIGIKDMKIFDDTIFVFT